MNMDLSDLPLEDLGSYLAVQDSGTATVHGSFIAFDDGAPLSGSAAPARSLQAPNASWTITPAQHPAQAIRGAKRRALGTGDGLSPSSYAPVPADMPLLTPLPLGPPAGGSSSLAGGGGGGGVGRAFVRAAPRRAAQKAMTQIATVAALESEDAGLAARAAPTGAASRDREREPDPGNIAAAATAAMASAGVAGGARRSSRGGQTGATAAAAAAAGDDAGDDDGGDGSDDDDDDDEGGGGGGRGGKGDRKGKKNMRERLRRQEINDAFEALTTLLAVSRKNKADKTVVLQAAVKEIEVLRARVATLEAAVAGGSAVRMPHMSRPGLPAALPGAPAVQPAAPSAALAAPVPTAVRLAGSKRRSDADLHLTMLDDDEYDNLFTQPAPMSAAAVAAAAAPTSVTPVLPTPAVTSVAVPKQVAAPAPASAPAPAPAPAAPAPAQRRTVRASYFSDSSSTSSESVNSFAGEWFTSGGSTGSNNSTSNGHGHGHHRSGTGKSAMNYSTSEDVRHLSSAFAAAAHELRFGAPPLPAPTPAAAPPAAASTTMGSVAPLPLPLPPPVVTAAAPGQVNALTRRLDNIHVTTPSHAAAAHAVMPVQQHQFVALSGNGAALSSNSANSSSSNSSKYGSVSSLPSAPSLAPAVLPTRAALPPPPPAAASGRMFSLELEDSSMDFASSAFHFSQRVGGAPAPAPAYASTNVASPPASLFANAVSGPVSTAATLLPSLSFDDFFADAPPAIALGAGGGGGGGGGGTSLLW